MWREYEQNDMLSLHNTGSWWSISLLNVSLLQVKVYLITVGGEWESELKMHVPSLHGKGK